MANQTITQLPLTSLASTGDVFYIVNDYESGSPTLTGSSAQIYFSAINQSISGVSLTNNVNNAVVTATGTSPGLNGESNLTFNGSNLSVTGSTTSTGKATFGNLLIGTGSTITATTQGTTIVARKPSQNFTTGTVTTVSGFTTFLIRNNWSEFDRTTGVFTATKSAVYRMTANMNFGTAASTVNGEFALMVYKNSTEIARGVTYAYTTASTYKGVRVHVIINVEPGDTLTFRAFQNGVASVGILANAAYQQFTIEELRNIQTK
jgi:hypothetical protein